MSLLRCLTERIGVGCKLWIAGSAAKSGLAPNQLPQIRYSRGELTNVLTNLFHYKSLPLTNFFHYHLETDLQ